ncbi:MAG: 50S ribosomal protein L25 [Bacteroidia bacterium]|nr:50S ribosomal protein L25 [Bacteroidia bacterium]
MKSTELKAFKRPDTGKASSKHMRREGKVPGVVYNNSEATHVFFDYKELKTVLYTPETYIVNLDVEGEKVSTIVRDADYHPVTEKILHVEMLSVSEDKPVIVSLPVSLVGKPLGVGKGGKLLTKLRKIQVKGIPSQLPDKVEIDVSSLELGHTIKIADANITGLNIVTPQTAGVASVEIPRALRSAGAVGEDGEEVAAEGGEEAAAEE